MAGSFALGDDDNDKLDYKKSPSSNANKIYFVVVVNLICHRRLVRTGPKGSFTPSDSVSKRSVDGQNWYAHHSAHHSPHQKDQGCRWSMLE